MEIFRFSVKLRRATIVDGWVHILLNEPGHQAYERWDGNNPLYNSVHKRISLRPSFKTLRHDVDGSPTAEEVNPCHFQELDGRRVDSVRCGFVAGLKPVDKGIRNVNLNLRLSAFRVNAMSFLSAQALYFALSNFHHDVGIAALVCARLLRRFCVNRIIDLLIR